jgi:hypothetical protein
MVMPVCSLVQPMSQDKGEEGKFWFADGTALDSMKTVVLEIVATRALWAPVDSGLGAPICRSADRRMGMTLYRSFIEDSGDPMKLHEEDQAYIPCPDCRFFETARSFEKVDDLWCPFGYTLLMVHAETDEPFLYFVKGMQMKPVKQRIVSPALLRIKKTGKATPYANVQEWRARLVEEKEKKRKYWVADIMSGDALSDAEQESYREMSISLRGRAAEQIEEAAAEEGQQEPA